MLVTFVGLNLNINKQPDRVGSHEGISIQEEGLSSTSNHLHLNGINVSLDQKHYNCQLEPNTMANAVTCETKQQLTISERRGWATYLLHS